MVGLVEDTNFPEEIYQLEKDDKVEGGPEGLSNLQAKQLANRTRYLKERLDNLTPMDVGAEEAGAALREIETLKADPNPFNQYLTPGQAATHYVPNNLANQPFGWPRLNEQGKVSASLLDIAASRYVVVADEAARLALSLSPDLTIAAQVDTDRLWYLNGGLDPSVGANWIRGQAATISGVSRVFGRTGEVYPQDNDYNADQIAETPERVFASPAEKLIWSAKQDGLVSGENIKTLNGITLLGSGNLAINYQSVGAAASVHKHGASDINNFGQSVGKEVAGLVKQGSNIHITKDPDTNEIQISALGMGGDSNYVFISRTSQANQEHVVDTNLGFEYYPHAYALKWEAGAANQNLTIENFNATSAKDYRLSTYMEILDDGLQVVKSRDVRLDSGLRWHETTIDNNVNTLDISAYGDGVVPWLTSNNGNNGFIPFASSEYFNGEYKAFKAFAEIENEGIADGWASSVAPTVANPQWIAIELPSAQIINGFSFKNRHGQASSAASPRRFTLQGSNDRITWENIGQEFLNTDNTHNQQYIYTVDNTKAFICYRLLITERNSTSTFVMLTKLNFFNVGKLAFEADDGSVLTLNEASEFIPLAEPLEEAIQSNGFYKATGLTNAMLANNNIVKVISPNPGKLKLSVFAGPQIALQKHPISLKHVLEFRTYTGTGTLTGTTYTHYPYAFSPDGVDYYVWKTDQWVSIGPLDTSRESATLLATEGTPFNVVNLLTWAHYKLLWEQLSLPVENLYIAHAINLPTSTSAVKLATGMVVVNYKNNWKLQAPNEVDIRYGDGYLRFKPTTAGEYKFAYRLP